MARLNRTAEGRGQRMMAGSTAPRNDVPTRTAESGPALTSTSPQRSVSSSRGLVRSGRPGVGGGAHGADRTAVAAKSEPARSAGSAWRHWSPGRRSSPRSAIRGRSAITGAFRASPRWRRCFDFEPVFRANVAQTVYDYTAHGADSEATIRRNRDAFGWVDVVAGTPIDADGGRHPHHGARAEPRLSRCSWRPTALQVALHPDGEVGMHQAATTTRTPFIISNNSSQPAEKIATSSTGPAWFQFYPRRSLDESRVAARPRPGRGLPGHRRHRRSAGDVLRTHAAPAQSRRPAARGRAHAAGGGSGAQSVPGRPRAGCGTSGATWIRSARSSAGRCW